MKCIFILLLSTAIYTSAMAQLKVRLKSDVSEKEQVDLTNAYATETFNSKNQVALFARMDSAVKMVFPQVPAKGVSLFVQAMVNKEGKVDHVIFDLFNVHQYNKDSLALKFRDALSVQMSQYRAVTPGETFQKTMHIGIGKLTLPREVRQVDSSLTDVPKAVACVDTLGIKILFLNDLELTEIPDVIYRFPNLEELYLGKNQIRSVDLNMKKLPKLTQLHLQENKITAANFRISKNKTLTLLNLNENQLTNIPRSAGNNRRLHTLWLGGNDLSALSSSGFKRMKRLKDLNLYKTNIASLPSGIQKLKRLEVMDLYHNNLKELPASVVRMKNLTHLAVSHNELAALPEKLSRLKKIHTLYAHHNHLSKLPKQITRLQEIKILDLGYNWFTDFPEEIIAFKKLEELDLSANNFHVFPAQLLKIDHLEKLYLRGNPFLENSAEVKYASELGNLKKKNIEVFH